MRREFFKGTEYRRQISGRTGSVGVRSLKWPKFWQGLVHFLRNGWDESTGWNGALACGCIVTFAKLPLQCSGFFEFNSKKAANVAGHVLDSFKVDGPVARKAMQ